MGLNAKSCGALLNASALILGLIKGSIVRQVRNAFKVLKTQRFQTNICKKSPKLFRNALCFTTVYLLIILS